MAIYSKSDIMTQTYELESAVAQTVLGTHDDNLKVLENQLAADIFVRGTAVTLTGPTHEIARARKVLDELQAIARRGHVISPESVKQAVAIVTVEAPLSVSKALAENIITRRGKAIRPKTLGQKEYVDAIDQNTIVFGLGPAGTGKTYLAMAKAVQALHAKQVSRIILTRPAVEAGEKLGFLPGTLNEKIDPYLRTLNDAFVILDEAQNTTPAQMKMFLTRLGFGSKMVVTGDITQVDLPGGQKSGLRLVRHILRGVDDVHFSELGSDDVVRHQLVSAIVDAYDDYETAQIAKQDRAE